MQVDLDHVLLGEPAVAALPEAAAGGLVPEVEDRGDSLRVVEFKLCHGAMVPCVRDEVNRGASAG